MNRQLLCSAITSVFITIGVFAQKESKVYKETFNIGDNVVLNIDTSNTDIEFETWDKNQVEIVATIELDGASKEEAELYFKNGGITIKGNSREIDVFTGRENRLFFNDSVNSWLGSNIDTIQGGLSFPELPAQPELPEFPVIANSPPIPNINFDYGAYQRDGEKYLKKWKKRFDKDFNSEYVKNFKKWGKEFEELNAERARLLEIRKSEYEERRSKLIAERKKMQLSKMKRKNRKLNDSMKELQYLAFDKRRAALVERRNERRETVNLRREQLQLRLDLLRSQRKKLLFPKRDSLRYLFRDSLGSSEPNIFYLTRDGDNKRYKIKKTIKIKMSKSVKLKMNVRHGEVKLAEATNNIDASLQYVNLLASTIDGNETNIRASYSPVQVQNWNYGQLKTSYSDLVKLQEVGELTLNSTSSNVVIDRLKKRLLLSNNLGSVQINSVSDDFAAIDVSIQNGELSCKVPKIPFSFYLNGTKSKVVYPPEWIIERTLNFDNEVFKGYQTNNNSEKSILINSKYSEISLKN